MKTLKEKRKEMIENGLRNNFESQSKSKAIKKTLEKHEEGKKPRLHYGSVNFTASNPSYKKPK